MVSVLIYFSVWLIIFCKDGIIGVYCFISYEYDGLVVNVFLFSVVELWEEIFKIKYTLESLCIYKIFMVDGFEFRKFFKI